MFGRRPCAPRVSRRTWLKLSLAGAATVAFSSGRGFAHARGRAQPGGRISLHVPWPLGSIDPHRLDDMAAAIFGEAIFDTLFSVSEQGPIPSLAERAVVTEGAVSRLTLREGVRTGAGKALDARDVLFSLDRARRMGARAWLTDIPVPKLDKNGDLLFATKDGARLERALSSQLCAIVPRGFSPDGPDGTGPFRMTRRADMWSLRRNLHAARGPSLLDEVLLGEAPDLVTSLRAFESGKDDIGWLGLGLHEPRPQARSFDLGPVGWVILRTGKEAATWDEPGVAQRACDGLPAARLASLSLGSPWKQEAPLSWGGAPTQVLVRDDSPWLMEVARAIAATLSAPGHELTVKPTGQSDLRNLRGSRAFAFMVDVARPLLPGTHGSFASLATADDPVTALRTVGRSIGKGDLSARVLTRTLRLGVIGEVRISGGIMPHVSLPASSTFGADFARAVLVRR